MLLFLLCKWAICKTHFIKCHSTYLAIIYYSTLHMCIKTEFLIYYNTVHVLLAKARILATWALFISSFLHFFNSDVMVQIFNCSVADPWSFYFSLCHSHLQNPNSSYTLLLACFMLPPKQQMAAGVKLFTDELLSFFLEKIDVYQIFLLG